MYVCSKGGEYTLTTSQREVSSSLMPYQDIKKTTVPVILAKKCQTNIINNKDLNPISSSQDKSRIVRNLNSSPIETKFCTNKASNAYNFRHLSYHSAYYPNVVHKPIYERNKSSEKIFSGESELIYDNDNHKEIDNTDVKIIKDTSTIINKKNGTIKDTFGNQPPIRTFHDDFGGSQIKICLNDARQRLDFES